MRTEFDFIRNIKKKYDLSRVGDDCAVIPKDAKTDLVVTADLLVEDIDFRLEWTVPRLLGHKALAVSLSDIAAMGARPEWALLSVAVPAKIWSGKFLDRFYEGWHELANRFGVELVGGDISRTDGKIAIDSVVAGNTKKGTAVLRSGARPGDSIFVTGSLGGAAAGLTLLDAGSRYATTRGRKKDLITRQLSPVPRVDAGAYLALRGVASSMIDISDGLAADLYHLCDASAVGARIETRAIPFDASLGDSAPKEKLAFALGGGEDFELLFTSPKEKISAPNLPPITRIGEITSNTGIVELVDDTRSRRLPRKGYRHF